MTATPDFSIRMQVAGMRGLLSEIIAVGALSKHGDTDLMERVREAADTPLPELPTRSCLAQIEEPAGAAPAAVASPADADLRKALQFYANGEHFILSERDTSWDTVSGEPQNYWCDEAGTATVEDGTIAKMALAGHPIDFEDDDAAPALEAPAAPAGDLALIIAALEHGQPQMAHYAEPCERHAKALAAARRMAAAPQAPAAPSAIATQVIENLLQLARIVNTAVEDWGESFEDGSSEVTFHKEEADKLEGILEFFDSLPDAPPEEDVIESGPLRAARVLRSLAAPAAPAVDAKAHDWRENASYGGEICAECGAAKGSRRGNAPCAWPPEPLDVCTDPYNCARCKTHPAHRGDMHHAGISRNGGSA